MVKYRKNRNSENICYEPIAKSFEIFNIYNITCNISIISRQVKVVTKEMMWWFILTWDSFSIAVSLKNTPGGLCGFGLSALIRVYNFMRTCPKQGMLF